MKQYTDLAPFYDVLNDGADYQAYYNFISDSYNRLRSDADDSQKRVTDLGCGTGEISIRLAQDGWNVTGVDLSQEMLSIADNKSRALNRHIMFTFEDKRECDL